MPAEEGREVEFCGRTYSELEREGRELLGEVYFWRPLPFWVLLRAVSSFCLMVRPELLLEGRPVVVPTRPLVLPTRPLVLAVGLLLIVGLELRLAEALLVVGRPDMLPPDLLEETVPVRPDMLPPAPCVLGLSFCIRRLIEPAVLLPCLTLAT